MTNIYIPNYSSGKCAYIRDKDTIRVYDSTPSYNSTINYTDIFINSDYLESRGSTTFNQYSTLPTCLSSSDITDDWLYRVDSWKFFIMFGVFVWLLCLIFKMTILRLFRRLN